MPTLFKTVSYVIRRLVRAPLFTAVTLLTLAIGIGGNTAVFTVVNGILLEPLGFENPERLVGVWHTAPGLGFEDANMSPALHFTYREENEVFEDIGMWDPTQLTVTGIDKPERVAGMMVTDGTLPVLGVRPVVGKLFTAEDDSPGTPETVILSHGFWQSRFGGDPGVVGRLLTVDGKPREIIGVLPADLQFLDLDPELFLPFRFDLGKVYFGNFSYQGVARLRPGVTIEQADQELARLIPIAADRFPMPDGFSIEVLEQAQFAPKIRPLMRDVVGDVGSVLWVLLGSVGIVLLIACANVANLFLARTEGRQQELAVRTALGASRRRLAGELLAESMILAVLGGVLGCWLAWAGVRALIAASPEGLPRLDEITVGSTVLLFNLGVSLVAGLVLGLLPTLRLGTRRLVLALKEGGRGGDGGRQRHLARSSLVVFQVASAVVLLIGSGLMIRSFLALREVDPGFRNPQEVLTLRLAIPEAEIEDPGQVAGAHEMIVRRLEQIPGVDSVGATTAVAMGGSASNDPIFVEQFPTQGDQLPPLRRFKWVAPGYLETMGNPVKAGRSITWADVHDRARVVVVSENFAREYWDNPAAALGQRIRQAPLDPWREIVGVVGDVHDDGVDQEAVPIIFWPMVLEEFWGREVWAARSMVYVLRSPRVGSPGLTQEVRDAVWAVNPNLPLANLRTLEEIFRGSMARSSFTLVLLAIAAAVALLLGTIGIYGVTSYTVSQRTREIGVRMVLGARRRDVSGLVLRQGAFLGGLGVVLGIAGALGLTRLMSAMLFGVSPLDPATFATVVLVLAMIALLASYFPARRAAGIHPIEALRWE